MRLSSKGFPSAVSTTVGLMATLTIDYSGPRPPLLQGWSVQILIPRNGIAGKYGKPGVSKGPSQRFARGIVTPHSDFHGPGRGIAETRPCPFPRGERWLIIHTLLMLESRPVKYPWQPSVKFQGRDIIISSSRESSYNREGVWLIFCIDFSNRIPRSSITVLRKSMGASIGAAY
ncbi:hypothetical protein CC78DRAFT_63348 [Lojkania enalia]|uniref:Uncharacterized protein n=1 Tax=Lojkania enalia TaxID=147567 RepID=A0A9P4N7Y1_9PLEO|nr:hypothetical protein CC78DRAFT_63348 [Didymosphaeria enalia]